MIHIVTRSVNGGLSVGQTEYPDVDTARKAARRMMRELSSIDRAHLFDGSHAAGWLARGDVHLRESGPEPLTMSAHYGSKEIRTYRPETRDFV